MDKFILQPKEERAATRTSLNQARPDGRPAGGLIS
jgi:hypothetical protein